MLSNNYAYDKWMEENETEEENLSLEYQPLFSFLVSASDKEKEDYNGFLVSLEAQTYSNWEICFGDDLNSALEKAKGDFVAVADCDVILAPSALYEVAKLLNKNKSLAFIYSDEDYISDDGKRYAPFFKPDWSPDTFFSFFYTNQFAVYRTETARKAEGFDTKYGKAQIYDFVLRFMELSENEMVGHIPKVLCHCKEQGKPSKKKHRAKSEKEIKKSALERRGYKGNVEYVQGVSQYRVVYYEPNNTKVSIIIPSKDNVKLLKQCVESILDHTHTLDYEIIVIDNGSGEENRQIIEKFLSKYHALYYYKPMDFNFSKMCNLGAELAKGDYLLFLNDDIEVVDGEWLDRMVGHAALPYVGAVGAKLLYPRSNTIQHIGVTNLGTGPSHSCLGFLDTSVYYFGRNCLEYNLLAVTAACLAISKEKFQEVGGFDENLTVAFNDVDLCFKLYEAGYYNVIRNDVRLFHYESASRGLDERSKEKKRRLQDEKVYLYKKHPNLEGTDPFYNPNLTQEREDFSLNVKNAVRPCARLGELVKSSVRETKFTVSLDCVEWEKDIYIQGWFFWKRDVISNRCKVDLVLRDKDDRWIAFETEKQFRRDVAVALDNKANHTGFACGISGVNIDLEHADYQIGVLITVPYLRKKLLCWTDRRIG